MGKIFYKNNAVILCLLIAVFCFSGSSHADIQEADLFEKAYEYYLAYQPEKAIETFDLFLQRFPDSSALDSVLFWRAKSLIQMKRAEEAAKGFRKLREVFPESSYSVFAEKELETLKNTLQKVEKADAVREKSAKTPDVKLSALEERIRKLEAEKIELEKQLTDAEKKRQITEKGLSKALDDKNTLESQLDELKRNRDNLEARAGKVKDASSQLEESRKKQEELVTISALNEKEMVRLKTERVELDARLRDADKRQHEAEQALKKISEEKLAIEAQLKDQQASLAKSQEALALLEKTFKGSEQEKAKQAQELSERNRAVDTEKKALQEELVREKKHVEELSGKAKDAASQLEDSRKKREELVARLDEMKRTLSDAQSRSAQSDKLDQDTRILLDEKRQLQMQVKDYEVKIAALSSQQDKIIALDRERKELAARFEEQEKKIKEQQSEVSGLKTEKGAVERELKESRAAVAAIKATKEGRGLLQTEVDQMNAQKQQMQTELAEMKRMNEQHATRNAELTSEVSDLRTRSHNFEKPFLRIGKERYSLAAIIGESETARSVTDKIQAKNVRWRTGNIIDDFIAEQILAQKAQQETLSSVSSAKESLMKQYALSADEGAYLDKYLAIDSLVKKRLAVPAIAEKDAREYYDKHREQYLHGRENRIRVLSLKFGKTDELEKSIIAVEMREEALEGRPLDAIARKRSAVAVMKEMSLSRLPDWVRVSLASIKEGEISNIISADNEFMIIQPIPSKPAYRSFEEVRKEIEKKLSAEQPGRKQSLEDWLNSLKKDVEFLRY